MRAKALLPILLPLSWTLSCSTAPVESQQSRGKVVLIFCDVTSSLNPEERDSVSNLAAQIVQNLDPPVDFQVLPILLDTERSDVLLEGSISSLVKPSDKARLAEKRKRIPAALKKKIAGLYESANRPSDPNRSCIVNALDRASRIFVQYAQNKNLDLHLIILSDMLEECETSPYGRILLNKKDIRPEIERAKGSVSLRNLSGVQVALVLPVRNNGSSYVAPPTGQLEEFWRAVFGKAGLTTAQDDSQGLFYFGAGLPQRMKKPW